MTAPTSPPVTALTVQEQDNLKLWNSWRSPPIVALKKIGGGRLKGMTDIDPMWRYGSLTRAFGPIGIGWYFEVKRTWEHQSEGETMVFAEVWLYVSHPHKSDPDPAIFGVEQWSKPIVGHGGNKLVAVESSGKHNNDDAYKMAVTDALGTACKMLGIAADVYAGRLDDSKYQRPAASGTLTETRLCSKCGSPMWDNTKEPKRFPDAPDFKCKDKACGNKEWLKQPDPAAAAAIDPPTPAR